MKNPCFNCTIFRSTFLILLMIGQNHPLYICLTIFWRVGSKKSHHVNRGSSTIILALPKLKEKSDIDILVHNSFYIHHPLLHLDIGKNYMRNVTSRFVCYPSIHLIIHPSV